MLAHAPEVVDFTTPTTHHSVCCALSSLVCCIIVMAVFSLGVISVCFVLYLSPGFPLNFFLWH